MNDNEIRYRRQFLALSFKQKFVKYDRNSQSILLNIASSWINEQKDKSSDDDTVARWLTSGMSHLDSKDLKSISNPLCISWDSFISNDVPNSLYFEKYLSTFLGYLGFGEDMR